MQIILPFLFGLVLSIFIYYNKFTILFALPLFLTKSGIFRQILVFLTIFQLGLIIGGLTRQSETNLKIVKIVSESEQKLPCYVEGKVLSSEVNFKGSRALLQGKLFSTGDNKISEKIKILCFLPISPPKPGSSFKANLLLSIPKGRTNIGQFDQNKNLKRKGIYLYGNCKDESFFKITRQPIFPFFGNYKNFLREEIINRCGEESGIVLSLLLGERGLLKDEEERSLVKTGLFHLIALSGLHIGIVVSIFYFLFSLLRIDPLKSEFLVLLSLSIYGFIVKDQPSIMRAIFMAFFLIVGRFFSRMTNPIRSIVISATLLLAFNPLEIFDVGFQLTYLATLGIIIFYKKIPQIFEKKSLKNYLFQLFYISLSAQIFTLPIIIYSFHRVPLLSFILTPIAIIPLIPLLFLGVLYIFGLSLIPFFSAINLDLIKIFAKIFISIPQIFSNLKFCSLFFPLPSPIYLFIFVFLIILFFVVKERFRLIFLLLIFPLILIALFFPLKKDLKDCMLVLDIGQGNSILLLKNNKAYLVDCGDTSYHSLPTGRAVIEPTLARLGIKRIEGIFITHWDKDHCGSLIDLVKDVDVKFVGYPECCEPNEHIKQLLYSERIKMIKLKSGDSFNENGINFVVYHPDCKGESLKENDLSLVLSASYNEKTILFTGDIEKDGEKVATEKIPPQNCDILLAPHHGAKNSLYMPFIDKVSPKFVVFSVGKNNRFNHPNPIVVRYYQSTNSQIFRTDKDGSLLFLFDRKKTLFYRYSIFPFDCEIFK